MYRNLRHLCLHFNNRAAKGISHRSMDLEGRKKGWMEGMKEGRRVGGREGREEGRKGGRKEGREDTTLTHTLISQLTVQVDG